MISENLTSRERVRRAFARQPIDRIPKHDSFWPDTLRRWEQEGLTGGAQAALDALGSDLHGLSWCWPTPFPTTHTLVSEDAETRVVRDGNGALLRHWKSRDGTPEHLGWECDSRDKWQRVFRPRMIAQLDNPSANFDAILGAQAEGRRSGKWCYLACVEAFEFLRAILGDEGSLFAMGDDPEWVVDLAAVFTDLVLAIQQRVLDRGVAPDGLWIYGDMAYNHGSVCSPAMYRELIWPQHQRMVEWAHARGMPVIYHTDGNIHGVLDLYVQAGIDCIHPLEAKAGMDVRVLAPQIGSRLMLFGNINAMVIESGDPDLIEAEIAEKFAAGKQSQCYFYHSDHSIPPSVSWSAYRKLIELVRRHESF